MKRLSTYRAVALLAICPATAFCQNAAPIESLLVEPTISAGGDGEYLQTGQMTEGRTLSDLTLLNFFSAGWDEEFSRRVRDTGTPDYALLRVGTNFMEREVRVNYVYDQNINSKTKEHLTNMDAFIAYAFNRRFMIEVLDNYQWVGARGKTADTDGGEPQLIGRFQLVDTDPSSYTFNFKFIAPDRGIGQTQTTFNYGIAGFNDLAYWLNLTKTGLYYSVAFDGLMGPHVHGALQNDVGYDISLARTLLPMDTPGLGGFTAFLEAFGQTNLDGSLAGATLVTLTPGVRFNLGKTNLMKFGLDNSILFGLDIPVSGPRPYDIGYRLTYIKNF